MESTRRVTKLIAASWIGIGIGIAVAAGVGAGCATPEQRRIQAIQREIDERIEEDEDRIGEIEDRYLKARAGIETAKKEEVAEGQEFRDRMLVQVKTSREAVVKRSLERQIALATEPDKRLEVRATADELEALYDELLSSTDRLTKEMVEARERARDRQLTKLDERRATLQGEVEDRRAAFVAARRAEIASIKPAAVPAPEPAEEPEGGAPAGPGDPGAKPSEPAGDGAGVPPKGPAPAASEGPAGSSAVPAGAPKVAVPRDAIPESLDETKVPGDSRGPRVPVR